MLLSADDFGEKVLEYNRISTWLVLIKVPGVNI